MQLIESSHQLITSPPGSGKSLLAMWMISQFVEQQRPVYTNIDGVTLKGVLPLPESTDWRDCVEGAVVVYDEAHKFSQFQAKGSEKLSTNPQLIEMNESRHKHYTLIFITQTPEYLHKHVLGLINIHYSLYRMAGWEQCQVYAWNEYNAYHKSESSRKAAFVNEKWAYDKSLYYTYKSASADSAHKNKRIIPKNVYRQYLKAGAFFVAAIVFLIIFLVTGKSTTSNAAEPVQSVDSITDTVAHAITQPKQTQSQTEQSSPVAPVYDDYQRPAMTVVKDGQCTAKNMYGYILPIDQEQCNFFANSTLPMSVDLAQQRSKNNGVDATVTNSDKVELFAVN